jgi:hypothetical protein
MGMYNKPLGICLHCNKNYYYGVVPICSRIENGCAAARKRWLRANTKKEYFMNRNYYLKNKKKLLAYTKNYQQNNKDKLKRWTQKYNSKPEIKIKNQSRQMTHWIVKKLKCIKIDKKCFFCNSTKQLEIHHIEYPTTKEEVIQAIKDNKIVMLCHKCHSKTFSKYPELQNFCHIF